MASFLKRVRWPWRKESKPKTPGRPVDAIRRLSQKYQRQRRLWAYIIISGLTIATMFFIFGVLFGGGFWVLTIPLVAMIFSVLQMRRCRELVRILRQALFVQRQIDKAEAETKRIAEEAAAKEAASYGTAQISGGTVGGGTNGPLGNGGREGGQIGRGS